MFDSCGYRGDFEALGWGGSMMRIRRSSRQVTRSQLAAQLFVVCCSLVTAVAQGELPVRGDEALNHMRELSTFFLTSDGLEHSILVGPSTTGSRIEYVSPEGDYISYSHFTLVDVVLPEDSTLTEHKIEALSEEVGVVGSLLDSHGSVVTRLGSYEWRSNRAVLTFTPTPGVTYRLILSTRGSADRPVEVRLKLRAPGDGGIEVLSAWRSRALVTGETNGQFRPGDSLFEGNLAHGWRIEQSSAEPTWYSVSALTDAFQPRLLVLTDGNFVLPGAVKDGHGPVVFGPVTRDCSAPDLCPLALLIVARGISSEAGRIGESGLGTYTLAVRTYPFDPGRSVALGWILYHLNRILANGVMALVIGTGLGALVAAFFHVRTLRSRRIQFREVIDSVIADQLRDQTEVLHAVASDGSFHPLQDARFFKVRIWHAGRARVSSAAIRAPIELHLDNVSHVVSLNHVASPRSGWGQPFVPPESTSTVVCPFEYLDARDELTLSLVCQVTPMGMAEGILPTLHGDVSETHIQRRAEEIPVRVLFWAVGAVSLIYTLMMPALYFDQLTPGQGFLPPGVRNLLSVLWITFVPTYLFALAFTSVGRQVLRSLFVNSVQGKPIRLAARRFIEYALPGFARGRSRARTLADD